ncbi:MAG: hypothetical protein ACI91O_001006 [Candidatus Poriferisodalaceae bacterium]|jgi:hypothetical protein
MRSLVLVQRMYRSASLRRQVRIVWDVITVWPRWFHPFAPPSYGGQAIGALEERTRTLTNEGHSVVLAGIVTYGSPIGTLCLPLFGEEMAHPLIVTRTRPDNRVVPDPLEDPTDDMSQPQHRRRIGHSEYEREQIYKELIQDLRIQDVSIQDSETE